MCRLKGTTLQSSFRDGDVILGASICALLQTCPGNRNPLLLPNVTLGYEIYDSCDYVSNAVEATLKLFSGRQDHVPGYRCTTKGPLAGFIGLPYSMAVLTQIYRYPHISYGAQDPVLDDKTLFPSFFRIVPNDRSMYAGFVQLLHYFGWTWVGLVTSDEEHNLRTSQELRAVLHESGICIAYFAVVSTKYILTYVHVPRVIEESKASVVISFCSHLSQYLKNLQMKSGEKLYSANEGPIRQYDIVNWVTSRGTVTYTQIGSFFPFAPAKQQLIINQSDIKWNHKFKQAPQSICSESCPPGYRKAQRKGQPVCCFDCILCSEDEFSNETDSTNCMKCPKDMWANKMHDGCWNRTLEFLSYEEVLGGTLASLSILGSLLPLSILFIFLKNANTPVVKANNRNLSYILLVSLFFCFLCVLMFIGRPITITCILRQFIFGISFVLCMSCVLGKTMMVVIAFNLTKPKSSGRMWLNSRVTNTLVLVCTAIQVIICAGWLAHSPPFEYTDNKSKMGIIIVECNKGSSVAYSCTMGYMGVLATLCFVVAYLVRKLPGSFNEAKLITFSMLIFGAVWISFIPAYLSTTGKYMMAVEVFAILSSSSGVVACIFLPKVYIIILSPEMNKIEIKSTSK
ncbi:extracellular calcium-sensing receptor-like [Xenopus laevis]|uniref:Extracellular calcium-sensing receptor-like n=1 Tax=Xenopus laevis TaxID=8355 RepID=A0A8J1LC73_XENLA|nr:extracellular calcium-sensing receptor-like [Xenopus laevis]